MEPILQIVESDLNGNHKQMVKQINEYGTDQVFKDLREVLEDEHVVDIVITYFNHV